MTVSAQPLTNLSEVASKLINAIKHIANYSINTSAIAKIGVIFATLTLLSGCGTLQTMGKTEEGSGATAMAMWNRWVESGGDIAATTTWERKVKPGVTVADIEQVFASVAAERNMKAVGEMPLSAELAARTGAKQKFLKVYSYCNPATARLMVDFSPHMAAFLPCRLTVVEKDDGLWIYTLNMDMMINMGRKLTPALKEEALKVRETIFQMLNRAADGEF
jgi:uncharacterized protein (DUF302 family)/uncharacterized protein YceK